LAFCPHYSVSAEDCPGHFYLRSAGHFPDPAFGLFITFLIFTFVLIVTATASFSGFILLVFFVAFLFPSAWQFHNFSGSLTVGFCLSDFL
jgi:hypothetical protein